ncbi:hypothetical protein AAL_02766 [Moelleriella libera RCEF 2490]|uniref:DUF1742-domain-containing protein n=1 Tax=Moelleriella libera RCEF 2490 TaxID=1081109 RepID=A0A168EWE8_9HYPO|nr:hypothetical protein AAL_02766 [Moelleriella libera RCEF 2490]
MSAPFPNLYTHRKVADAAAKACDVCYKPSSSVLITADKLDFFYVCPAHLKDPYFCSPKIDEIAVKARRERALAAEKEKLKKEYEEKQRKKNKDPSKADEDGKGAEETKAKEVKKKDETDERKQAEDLSAKEINVPDEEPRIFELKSAFYQQRLQRKRQVEAAKRDKQRASQPGYFPTVPSELPKK